MSVVQRKKNSRKKCRHCKHWEEGWCDIFYSRHDANTPRCKDNYEPAVPWFKSPQFWIFLLLGIVMAIGAVVKLTGG